MIDDAYNELQSTKAISRNLLSKNGKQIERTKQMNDNSKQMLEDLMGLGNMLIYICTLHTERNKIKSCHTFTSAINLETAQDKITIGK